MPQPEHDAMHDDVTQPILVRYDMPETDQQRALRLKQGKPTPTYSFMCSRVTDKVTDTKAEK